MKKMVFDMEVINIGIEHLKSSFKDIERKNYFNKQTHFAIGLLKCMNFNVSQIIDAIIKKTLTNFEKGKKNILLFFLILMDGIEKIILNKYLYNQNNKNNHVKYQFEKYILEYIKSCII